jgi:hypothetical protein
MSSCPVDHTKQPKQPQNACPVDHTKLNPHNMMPELNHEMQPGQTMKLSAERTESSIINTTTNTKWEYPSPQVCLFKIAILQCIGAERQRSTSRTC